MGMNQKQAEGTMYNLRSQVDGMVQAVKSGVLSLSKALEVIGAAVADAMEKDSKAGGGDGQ